ncbi:hypothetical protein DAT35_25130 [Vitiosangium sp. GDMCC 1.1324]|nr:hypothetical protein DAT35_25130 [Vitiosangium sp. GDMCC 1.1324]
MRIEQALGELARLDEQGHQRFMTGNAGGQGVHSTQMLTKRSEHLGWLYLALMVSVDEHGVVSPS